MNCLCHRFVCVLDLSSSWICPCPSFDRELSVSFICPCPGFVQSWICQCHGFVSVLDFPVSWIFTCPGLVCVLDFSSSENYAFHLFVLGVVCVLDLTVSLDVSVPRPCSCLFWICQMCFPNYFQIYFTLYISKYINLWQILSIC